MSGTNKGSAIDVAIMMGSKSDLETMRPARSAVSIRCCRP
jgi:phosphoribosylcarboxyaminoimidazole (NCAIR) mutase